MNQKKSWKPWLIAALVLSAAALLLYLLGNVLTPFIIAAVLAYILNPLVEYLQQHKMSRVLASMLVMLLALAVLLALLLIMIPMVFTQFQNLSAKLPALADFMQNKVLPHIKVWLGDDVLSDPAVLMDWLKNHLGSVQQSVSNVAQAVVKRGGEVALGLSNVILLPLLLYYFLLDWSRWAAGVYKMIPRRFIDTYKRVTREIDEVLSEFLRGQLMVMLIMGVFYGLGLVLVGLDSGFAIGMIAGLLVFVPYLGAFTGLLLASLAAILQYDTWHGLLWVWAVFGLGQLLESFIITPKIVGDRIGLSPFWVIFSLMAFGQLLGFVGMLAGLPLAAVCLVLIREACQAYFGSDFYQQRD
ncbi:MAG: AI-2E family transporter [Neisseria sp.]|nr:AI-2E family transporter [Neisseria sp.]